MKKTTTTLILLATLFLTSCSSTSQTTTVKEPAKEQSATKEKYTRVTPTGSWISQRVKKSQAQTNEKEAEEAQRAMSELQRRGNKVERGPGG